MSARAYNRPQSLLRQPQWAKGEFSAASRAVLDFNRQFSVGDWVNSDGSIGVISSPARVAPRGESGGYLPVVQLVGGPHPVNIAGMRKPTHAELFGSADMLAVQS